MLEMRLVPPVLGLGCCSGYRNGFILTSASIFPLIFAQFFELRFVQTEMGETICDLLDFLYCTSVHLVASLALGRKSGDFGIS